MEVEVPEEALEEAAEEEAEVPEQVLEEALEEVLEVPEVLDLHPRLQARHQPTLLPGLKFRRSPTLVLLSVLSVPLWPSYRGDRQVVYRP